MIFVLFSLTRVGTGIRKRFLSLDDRDQTVISYFEKGRPVPGQTSLVFFHGFSGRKESWLNIVKVSIQ